VIQRFAPSLFVVATIVGIACVDMSAPKGAASVSGLLLPSPSVIVGDTMRDSLGVAKPITVRAFDAAGNPIDATDAQVFVTDTLKAAHFTTTSILVGDKVGTTRLLGQVNGLQTAGVSVPVTYRPAKFLLGTKPDTVRPTIGADSATSLASSGLATLVKSAFDSASQGIIVRFTLVRSPAKLPSATGAPAFLASTTNAAASRDTTDVSGTTAHIRLVVNGRNLDTTITIGGRLDSAIVQAESFHNGKALAGSPLTIIVPIHKR